MIRLRSKAAVATLLLACVIFQAAHAQTVSNAGFAYPSYTPQIYFQFAAESEGKFTATLYVVNVGDRVPAGYEMASITLQGKPAEVLNYTYLAPANGWPPGIYRIVVSRDAEPVHQSDFHVFAAQQPMPDPGAPTAAPQPSNDVIEVITVEEGPAS